MKLTLAVLVTSFVVAGHAADPKEQDHAAHHPPDSASAASPAPTPGQMDTMMKSMQEMHDQMMSAKTAEDRTRLMHEHTKFMQGHMAMMGPMRGGKGAMEMGGSMPMSPEMIGKRMDMMEMMMKMMIDHEAMKSPATR